MSLHRERSPQVITAATAVDFIWAVKNEKLKQIEHGSVLILFACSVTSHLAFGSLFHVGFSRTVFNKAVASYLFGRVYMVALPAAWCCQKGPSGSHAMLCLLLIGVV